MSNLKMKNKGRREDGREEENETVLCSDVSRNYKEVVEMG